MNQQFYLSEIDKRVAEMSDDQVWQLCLDGDQFDRKGSIGNSLLRDTTEQWLHQNDRGHDQVAIYMLQFVAAAHKRRSIQLLDAQIQIDVLTEKLNSEVDHADQLHERLWWMGNATGSTIGEDLLEIHVKRRA